MKSKQNNNYIEKKIQRDIETFERDSKWLIESDKYFIAFVYIFSNLETNISFVSKNAAFFETNNRASYILLSFKLDIL